MLNTSGHSDISQHYKQCLNYQDMTTHTLYGVITSQHDVVLPHNKTGDMLSSRYAVKGFISTPSTPKYQTVI